MQTLVIKINPRRAVRRLLWLSSDRNTLNFCSLPVFFFFYLSAFVHRQVKECQVLLFSATVPSWVRNIANKYTANPLTVDAVGKNVSINYVTYNRRGAVDGVKRLVLSWLGDVLLPRGWWGFEAVCSTGSVSVVVSKAAFGFGSVTSCLAQARGRRAAPRTTRLLPGDR